MTPGCHDGLIEALAAGLRPVRRLPRPAARAAVWLAVVGGAGLLLAGAADLGAVRHRLGALPDLRLALAAAIATAGLAALSAFQLCIPGRSPRWLLLPLPAAAAWLAASGWGCLRGWGLPGLAPADAHDSAGCAMFIAAVSLPLSAPLLLMLRRAGPLRPVRVAAMGGLAAAAAAACLLALFHPHDASVLDTAVHAAAVAAVAGLSAAGARARMAPPRLPPAASHR